MLHDRLMGAGTWARLVVVARKISAKARIGEGRAAVARRGGALLSGIATWVRGDSLQPIPRYRVARPFHHLGALGRYGGSGEDDRQRRG